MQGPYLFGPRLLSINPITSDANAARAEKMLPSQYITMKEELSEPVYICII